MSGDVAIPNDLLRRAALELLSPSGSGRRLSRAELEKACNAWVVSHYRTDANYAGELERGVVRRRQALRVVLCAVSDAQLGFTPRPAAMTPTSVLIALPRRCVFRCDWSRCLIQGLSWWRRMPCRWVW
jgi:hypothetical protein